MLTDAPLRKANRAQFLESDQMKTLDLPKNGRLPSITKSIESAMKGGKGSDVRRACTEFLGAASDFYRVPNCAIRVLAARPLRVRERGTPELFGDYDPETSVIRVWMRTAVRKEVTSFGTFLSTLCHEYARKIQTTGASNSHIALSTAILSATISISRSSDSRTHGTLAGSTREPLCCTTMRVQHR